MSAEGNPGDNRIQNPDKAHDVANMMSAEANRYAAEDGKDVPTVMDYEMALDTLERLEEKIKEDGDIIPVVEKIFSYPSAVFGVIVENVLQLPRPGTEGDKPAFIDKLKSIGSDYDAILRDMAPAREELERLKAEAKELAQRQNEQ